jgi:hypothetical protein
MKRFLLLLAAGFFFSACSGLPKVHPARDFPSANTHQTCRNVFPEGKWQFVHSIEAVIGGKSVFVTGVAVISPAERSFRCAIMTIEGLAVFDAEWGPELTVNRAMAPFDSRPFAQGLAADIRLLFLYPSGFPFESGFLKNGASICRYRDSDGEIVDLVTKGDGNWEIRRYASDFRLLRTVHMAPGKKTGQAGVAQKIELTAHGSQGYKLTMNLIEAVPIEE